MRWCPGTTKQGRLVVAATVARSMCAWKARRPVCTSRSGQRCMSARWPCTRMAWLKRRPCASSWLPWMSTSHSVPTPLLSAAAACPVPAHRLPALPLCQLPLQVSLAMRPFPQSLVPDLLLPHPQQEPPPATMVFLSPPPATPSPKTAAAILVCCYPLECCGVCFRVCLNFCVPLPTFPRFVFQVAPSHCCARVALWPRPLSILQFR